MVLWLIFAAMTAAATMAVLWPLSRGRHAAAAAPEDHDIAVYRDQLDEVARDLERGLIGVREAEAARTEIARRMLAVDRAAGPVTAAPRLVRAIALACAAGVPAAAVGLYLLVGSPDLPGRPLEARLADADETDIEAMVAKVERHLAANPADAEGWRVIAPVYARLGRFGDAARAFAEVARIEGPSAQLFEDRGEMLVAAGGGFVSPEAEEAFGAALAADPSRPKARFYRALALAQSRRFEEAVAEYDSLIADSPPDAPWLDAVRTDREAALAAAREAVAGDSGPAAPGPDAAAVAAASDMTADERSAMIDTMVEGLAARLAEDPDDAAGWERLIRAYGVLGRDADAAAAWKTASETFAGAPEALAGIRAVAAEAGVAVD